MPLKLQKRRFKASLKDSRPNPRITLDIDRLSNELARPSVPALFNKVRSKIQPFHTQIDIGTAGHVLGRQGCEDFMFELQKVPERWIWFRAEARKQESSEVVVKHFNPLPIILETLPHFPNLASIELSFHFRQSTIEGLYTILDLPKLQFLALTNHGFESNLFSSFLQRVRAVLPRSRLRTLSLAGTVSHSDVDDEILKILRVGRRGLEGLDLGRAIRTLEGQTNLVEEVETYNKTILNLHLHHSAPYGLSSRLWTALAGNRTLQQRTQKAALALRRPLRILLQQPRTTSSSSPPPPSSSSGFKPNLSTFANLPLDVIFEIVAVLSPRQIRNLVTWTSDRTTLGPERKKETGKGFLKAVDCWRWDGYE
ncbi:hypothetical protein BDY24DRAFT_418171 [Mrakia frigida]|uniref:uncharacterized protein n=1 Tax=Mrakia frigida TaxID=29902 RepID=UPI003FCC077A